jgi:hypothetical protein
MGTFIEVVNLEPRYLAWIFSSLSPGGEPNRFSSSYRCGRYKFRFRLADGRPTNFFFICFTLDRCLTNKYKIFLFSEHHGKKMYEWLVTKQQNDRHCHSNDIQELYSCNIKSSRFTSYISPAQRLSVRRQIVEVPASL